MSRAVLSMGSNLGDPLHQLRAAARGLDPWTLIRSPIYRTKPWGPVPQQDYLNAVVIVDDGAADEWTWLWRARELEHAGGRTRAVTWGPRTVDVDVIAVDDVRSDDPDLTLPHPRAAQRAFVLVPWLAAEPEARLPGLGSVAELLAALPAGDIAGVRRAHELDWN